MSKHRVLTAYTFKTSKGEPKYRNAAVSNSEQPKMFGSFVIKNGIFLFLKQPTKMENFILNSN
jgi:hypothetical protein